MVRVLNRNILANSQHALRALLVHAGQRLGRQLSLLPGLRDHLPGPAPAQLAHAAHTLATRRPRQRLIVPGPSSVAWAAAVLTSGENSPSSGQL